MRVQRAAASIAFLLTAASAFADEATIVSSTNASATARDLSLAVQSGELVVRYTDSAGEAKSVKAADVIEISFRSGRTPAPAKVAPEDVKIILTTGDILMGKVGAKPEDGLQVLSKAFGDPVVKFGQIRAILFPANEAFLPKRLPEKELTDVILTKTGDRAEGILRSVSPAGVVYRSNRLETDVTQPLAQVAGIWLAEEVAPPKEPAALFATVFTTDRSSVRGVIESLNQGVLAFKDLYGTTHRVPANLVAGIYVKNGRVVYLSDLTPATVDEDANFIRGAKRSSSDLEYPYQRDQNARGSKILLSGAEHRKGLGVRAHSALTYSLGGGYRRFQATLGLDDISLGLGAVIGEVWVDGKKVKELSLKGKDAPQPIDLDVSNAKELKLVVTWAGHGQSDFAGWGSARLVR